MTGSPLRLSVLDQSPIIEGGNAATALRDSVELAVLAERLGYHRYWVAEHHHSASFAGAAPEILAATILQATDRMRVGSGAVLLPLYPSGKVAELFGTLAALHPGRVDLGVGRASMAPAPYARQVGELAMLTAHDDLELWVMGAGTSSAPLAATVGASYAHAHFFDPTGGPRAIATFHQGRSDIQADGRSRPSAGRSALAIRIVNGGTEAEAAARAEAVIAWRHRKDRGIDTPIPPTPTAGATRSLEDPRFIVGTHAQVAHRLVQIAAEHRVAELILTVPVASLTERKESLEAIRDALELAVRPH